MANINPKLNLNKTPNLVNSNSLIFAKNIRLDVDGTIHRDYSTFPLSMPYDKINQIRNKYDNLGLRIVNDLNIYLKEEELDDYSDVGVIKSFIELCCNDDDSVRNKYFKIVGIISSNNEFYLFIDCGWTPLYAEDTKDYNLIIRYDEYSERFYVCPCNWKWNNGTIEGCLINNLRGEKILVIGEYNANKNVPIKSINLSKSIFTDDESIYTQTPNIPITNFNYQDRFNYIIPNGTYQFFIRYKIRDNFYTDWFPASRELFAGNSNTIDTSYGTVKYVDEHRDSNVSFRFSVEHLNKEMTTYYESFQIGFICSHDDEIVARSWKHFGFNIDYINFDYESNDVEEIEIADLTKTTYQLYNVGNITSFKNKVYISNYTESNFNDINLQEYANKIGINIELEEDKVGYGGYDLILSSVRGEEVISGLKLDEDTLFSGENGIIHKLLLDDSYYGSDRTIYNAISKSLNNENAFYRCGSRKWEIDCFADVENLIKAQNRFKKPYINNKDYNNFSFQDKITSITINNNKVNQNVDEIIQKIYEGNRYLNFNCTFINNKGEADNTYEIIITRPCSYVMTTTTSGGITEMQPIEDENGGIQTRRVNDSLIIGKPETKEVTIHTYYTQKIVITIKANKRYLNAENSYVNVDYTTLIPYQKYKFYIHYIKQNGEVTNGYYCGGENAGVIEAPYSSNANKIIYPKFSNIEIPNTYKACFFSIIHCESNVATVFNIANGDNTDYQEGSCLDIDLGLFSGLNKINIKQETDNGLIETNSAKYHYSGDSSNIRYFGADGVLTWETLSESQKFESGLAYAINTYQIPDSEDVQLIKCTPYIDNSKLEDKSYSDYSNMNLLGYICQVYKLNRDKTIKYFTDTNSVFKKEDNNNYFSLKELNDHIDQEENADEIITMMGIITTRAFTIYSNYNLNYLQLTERPKENYKTYYIGSDGNTRSYNLVMRLFASLSMSNIYTLPSMYKSYTRKVYSTFTKNSIIRFDNTVRSSLLEGDEASMDLFKFDANDYYNVPTTKGIIVNMVAIGDAILVHTKDSMFRFSGSNTLQSTDGEIQTTENTPFETGIAEIFGSDFGFAGLQNKSDHIITENGYIFFDRDSRIVYMYSGQNQMTKVSDEIEKLFRHRDIKNIHFANDYYNNRFFMSIIFYDYDGYDEYLRPVTLSFSTLDDIKSFVSLHDFYYFHAFNTKTKCYFLTTDNEDICHVDKNEFGIYTKLELTSDFVYPNNYTEIDINTNNGIYNTNSFDSIIDIIDNNNYERIKTLNAINWCSRNVESEFKVLNKDYISNLKMAESFDEEYPCKAMRVYSDSCCSPLFDFSEISNNISINSLNEYKYPRYNQGIWTYNYFRNIQNSKTNFPPYVSDNNSLIEGKYFVVRFLFNKEFKLETLSLNYNYKS